MTDKPKPIRISAKDLGALAMPEACPRCFWIKQKCKPLPFQMFPGIFMSIDAYVKKVIHASFDFYKKPPIFIPEFKDAFIYHKVPHWSKFVRVHEPTGITLSGVPDDLLEQVNGSLIIPDYKTAKYTETQDKLYPMYEAQLNGYAWIQESLSDKPVAMLCLVYCEPVTDPPPPGSGLVTPWPINKLLKDGFDMAFRAKTVTIKQNTRMVDALLLIAKSILSKPEPPEGIQGCEECASLDKLRYIIFTADQDRPF